MPNHNAHSVPNENVMLFKLIADLNTKLAEQKIFSDTLLNRLNIAEEQRNAAEAQNRIALTQLREEHELRESTYRQEQEASESRHRQEQEALENRHAQAQQQLASRVQTEQQALREENARAEAAKLAKINETQILFTKTIKEKEELRLKELNKSINPNNDTQLHAHIKSCNFEGALRLLDLGANASSCDKLGVKVLDSFSEKFFSLIRRMWMIHPDSDPGRALKKELAFAKECGLKLINAGVTLTVKDKI